MNNQNAPLVSIIVPVYKTELYLRACLDSVYGQTYKNFEVICIDDGSPDNSISILKQFKQEHENFRYYSQNNQGLSATRNNGIRLAKGKYILPLDSDDILDYDCLKKLVEAVENGECDISTPEIVYFYPDEHLYHYLGQSQLLVIWPNLTIYVVHRYFPKVILNFMVGMISIILKKEWKITICGVDILKMEKK